MLREAPGIASQLKLLSDDGPSGTMLKFLSSCVELRSQTFQKLSSSVEEEKAKEDWFLEVSAREEKASQTLRQLQKEVKGTYISLRSRHISFSRLNASLSPLVPPPTAPHRFTAASLPLHCRGTSQLKRRSASERFLRATRPSRSCARSWSSSRALLLQRSGRSP